MVMYHLLFIWHCFICSDYIISLEMALFNLFTYNVVWIVKRWHLLIFYLSIDCIAYLLIDDIVSLLITTWYFQRWRCKIRLQIVLFESLKMTSLDLTIDVIRWHGMICDDWFICLEMAMLYLLTDNIAWIIKEVAPFYFIRHGIVLFLNRWHFCQYMTELLSM